MIGVKLNRVFSSKPFYIAFSLLVSIVLWMFVEISENRDVPFEIVIDSDYFEFLGEEIFNDRGLVIASTVTRAVTLRGEAPRSVVSKLSNRSVSLTVDLSEIRSEGPAYLEYNIVYPSDVDSSLITRMSPSVGRVALTVDVMHYRDIRVDVIYNGGTSSAEFLAKTPEWSPQVITVYGPEAIVSRIDKAVVPIPRENLATTYNADLSFVLIDNESEELEEAQYNALSFSQDTVHVTVPISMIKDVNLTVELVYGAGATEQNTRVTVHPAFVTVSGDPDAVMDYNSITLTAIDVTKFGSTYTDMYPIILQNGFTNESAVTEALVTVEVLGLEIKHLSVSTLFAINVPRDMKATVITQSTDVMLRGERASLENITAENIWVTADMSDHDPGTYVVPARIYMDSDISDVGAIGSCTVTVRIESA
ncbi:MAG: hypothetical protein FWG48_06125 [Oscillospiraceae bacterium]|jgi:hypothetical protein|nr:hypothetical protein [Oscillospiraceae bacterium]